MMPVLLPDEFSHDLFQIFPVPRAHLQYLQEKQVIREPDGKDRRDGRQRRARKIETASFRHLKPPDISLFKEGR